MTPEQTIRRVLPGPDADAVLSALAGEGFMVVPSPVWTRTGCVAMVDGAICGRDPEEFQHHPHDIISKPHGAACHPYAPGFVAAIATPENDR